MEIVVTLLWEFCVHCTSLSVNSRFDVKKKRGRFEGSQSFFERHRGENFGPYKKIVNHLRILMCYWFANHFVKKRFKKPGKRNDTSHFNVRNIAQSKSTNTTAMIKNNSGVATRSPLTPHPANGSGIEGDRVSRGWV